MCPKSHVLLLPSSSLLIAGYIGDMDQLSSINGVILQVLNPFPF